MLKSFFFVVVVGWVGGPCDFSVSPSPFGHDFGTLDFGTSDSGTSDSGLTILSLRDLLYKFSTTDCLGFAFFLFYCSFLVHNFKSTS